MSNAKPPKKPEKPPWANYTPVKSGKMEKIPLSRLNNAQKRNVWLGLQKLNKPLADAMKQHAVAAELDGIDMLTYYEAGEKIAAELDAKQRQQPGESYEP